MGEGTKVVLDTNVYVSAFGWNRSGISASEKSRRFSTPLCFDKIPLRTFTYSQAYRNKNYTGNSVTILQSRLKQL